MLELDVVRDLVPKNQRDGVTQDLIDKMNEWNEDPLLIGSFKENMLSYVGVLKDGKFKIEDYMNAVKYVSHKLLGDSDIDAYAKTFPERYKLLVDEGLSRSQMSPYTSAYKKNKLVNQIFEQTLVPNHVLNAPLYQSALNVQADLMLSAKSEMVRMNAANSILTHLKAPEVTKIELDVDIKQTDSIAELQSTMSKLAEQQVSMIADGSAKAKEVVEMDIITAEVIE